MTRKDYKAIAEVLKWARDNQSSRCGVGKASMLDVLPEIAERLAGIMAADNENFDRVRFLEACGL